MSAYKMGKFSQELLDAFSYIHRVTTGLLQRRSDALAKGRITMPQFIALDLLKSAGAMKMNDIARALRISLPAATGLVNRLVAMKMVERMQEKGDRRVVLIELTNEGARTIHQVSAARREVIEEIFGCLTDGERNAYLSVLRKIKKSLHEKMEKEDA